MRHWHLDKESQLRDSGTHILCTALGIFLVNEAQVGISKLMELEDTFVSEFFCGSAKEVGDLDGEAQTARFKLISGICADEKNKSLFVTDSKNCNIRKINMIDGYVKTYSSGSFTWPTLITVDKMGTLFVVDWTRIKLIKTVDQSVSTLSEFPSAIQSISFAYSTNQLFVLCAGELFIADTSQLKVISKLQTISKPCDILSNCYGRYIIINSENRFVFKHNILSNSCLLLAGQSTSVLVDSYLYTLVPNCVSYYLEGVEHAVTLYQKNLNANNSKFYVIHLAQEANTYYLLTQWGRVGQLGYHKLEHFQSDVLAVNRFQKKFKNEN